MSSSRRLWLLWQMAEHVGRPRFNEDEPPLFAEDILRLELVKGIAGIELVRLERAGDLHPIWYHWMLVIHLDEPDAQLPVEAFFDELWSVGARPILLREAD